jgi:8-oxo-dGTP pyrophosphatase MutT (NUDIX family)
MSADNSDSVRALPSATIVLVREAEAESDPEILMVRRRAGDAFGDSYAFPGGIVDSDESDAHAYCRGLTAERADQELSVVSGGLDYYSAAIRELFEETGILLARDPRGNWAFSNESESESLLRELRGKLDSGSLPWAELLRSNDLCIACDALRYFSFWETPVRLPKRWAARFFLAQVPPGQNAEHDGNELIDSCWMTATEALSSGEKGSMKLPFPTIVNLRNIGEHRTVDALLGWASAQTIAGVAKIRPVILKDKDQVRFVIPGDDDYPDDGDE